MTDFDFYNESQRSGPMGSLWATSKGTHNGASSTGRYFYPSGGDDNTTKEQRFSLSRAIDFASIDTANDDVWNGVGPKAWAGNMTSAGWVNSLTRREALWNQTSGFWNYRMMDKSLGVSSENGYSRMISEVWGSFSSSDPQKRR